VTLEKGRLKILFLSREYPPETGWGGIGSYVASIASTLAGRGHEVHVLSCVRGQKSRDLVEKGVWIHRRSRITIRGLGRLLRSQEAAARIATALTCYLEARRLRVAFDVIEAPEYMAEGLLFALTRSKPLVVHLHTPALVTAKFRGKGTGWEARLSDFLERISVHRANVVTSPSLFLVEYLRRQGWLGDRAISIVRLPIDLESWRSSSFAPASGPTVLAVGRVEARKAPEVLVRASARLAPEVSGLQVVFAGRSNGRRDGLPYREWLQDYIKRMDAPCVFADSVPREALPTLYGAARVVAVASRLDNFPMAGLEAMASGRPVVCTTGTGLAEIIGGTRGGTVVPADDPEALAAALRPYLLDPALAAHAGAEARTIVTRHCAPEKIAREREACYAMAIEEWEAKRMKRGLSLLSRR
jgi:glycogen(starch) synthase